MTYGLPMVACVEQEAYRIRKSKSARFRRLVEDAEVYGDRGYEGVEGVHVCRSKEDKSIRQVVEGVLGCVKSFNAISRWRKGITLLWLFHCLQLFQKRTSS